MRVIVVILAIVILVVAAIRQPTLPSHYVAHSHTSAQRLMRDVVTLSTTSRCADDTPSLDRVATFIENEFRRSGARVTLQPYVARKHSYRNVVASFGPDDGQLTIVGAHYDAFCEPRPFPGADDNASGVAALLELARMLSREHVTHPIALVAYSTEEPPFFASAEMGSAVHARSLGSKPARAIVLEMIGCFTDDASLPGLLQFLYPKRGDFIVVEGRWRDVMLTREVKRGMSAATRVVSFTGPAVDASDQRNYWLAGREAVMITDTAYIRNPRYHSARDTADTLDYKRMSTVVDGVLNALLLAH